MNATIRIGDTLKVPGRGIVATVEVMSGKLFVGSKLASATDNAVWEIRGFGHTTPGVSESPDKFDLLLKSVDENSLLTNGLILHELASNA
jgi:hypothetical protein